MRVCMWPTPDEIEPNHGVGAIVHAQFKYLPALGVEFVANPAQANIVASHTQQTDFPYIDVLHLHGMYWTGDPLSGQYNKWHTVANMRIIEAARRAHIITVPSDWTAEPFRRDMRISPRVVGHGIDFGIWEPADNLGYVLWNKNRPSDVCDPTPVMELGRRGARLVTTFVPEGLAAPENVSVVGVQPHDKMAKLIQHAAVYLATVKETYGIGTLEAMACGVPILGFRHGGTAAIVEHGVTGYLAKPGDYDELWEGLMFVMAHRDELGANARQYARERDWSKVIGQYANVYDQALKRKQSANGQVSIIITNYNYGKYLRGAIQSALDQTTLCEIVVVDDGSSDNSSDVIREMDAAYPGRIRSIFQTNSGVAAARNAGIGASTGEFQICLDADDRLDFRYAETLRNFMLADRGMGIAYSGLSFIDQDDHIQNYTAWPPAFNWEGQAAGGIPPSNAIPSACMFRKDMWLRAGPIKQEYAPGEDAEFWTRGLSVGFTAAKVVEDGLFHYRSHSESASKTKKYVAIDAFLPWIRDKIYPMGAPVDSSVPAIRSYSAPKVSVIIPVSSNHVKFLPQALDSLLGQTLREWEVIVIDDDGSIYKGLPAYPFARIYAAPTVQAGSSACRNLGLDHARAPLVLFLDADDWLMPEALQSMCDAYSQSDGRYIYTDWLAVGADVHVELVPPYDPIALMHAPQHAVTVLMATSHARQIKFDESLAVLEEWDFFARCALQGIQGAHIAKALIAVRIHPDRKTEQWGKRPDKDEYIRKVYARYDSYRKGEAEMPGCCGGGAGDAVLAAKMAAMGMASGEEPPPIGEQPLVVRMEFVGLGRGASSWGGPGVTASGKRYRGGNNPLDRYVDADPRDVFWLENSGEWKRRILPKEKPSATPADQTSVVELLGRMTSVESIVGKESIPAAVPVEEEPTDLGISVPKKRGRPKKVKVEEPS